MRMLMYASGACVIFACVTLVVTAGHGWSWWLFVWGVAVGPLSVACSELTEKAMIGVFHVSAAEVDEKRPHLRARKLAIYPVAAMQSVACGVLAAGLRSSWPDIIWTAGVVLLQLVLPLAILPLLKRRLATR
jgi:hypothetical protein